MRVVMAAVMGLVAGVVAIPMTARAEVTKGYHLGYEQLFSAVCRYVRLDQGGTLVERDSEAGFVIFTWKRDRESKEVRGTFEFVRRDGGDKPTIDLKLTISDAPKYIEEFFFDGLTKKLKKEYPDSEAK